MIVAINGKQREIKDLKVVSHTNVSAVDGEKVGEVEYAQYTVVGKNSGWIDWTPLDEFKAANPEVDI